MNRISVIILCLTFGLLYTSVVHGYPTAKVTAKAVDEQGNPISEANVSISFMKAKEKEWGMTTHDKNGKSDKDGLYSASGEGTQSVSVFITKDGYYPSGDGVKLITRSSLLNRWEPWNPTVEVVLKKKRNPVPMIIKGTDWVAVPKLDTPIGFDLEKCDWVAPYGKGLIADLTVEFNLSSRSYTDYDANMTVTFTNGQDGIQEYWFDKKEQSLFNWPFEAPSNGYKRSVNIFERDSPKDGYKTNKKENVNYIFRVRTQLDKDGNVISAKYGKIEGEFGISRKGKTKMYYLFNLDGTRNLEEDPEKNLFKKK